MNAHPDPTSPDTSADTTRASGGIIRTGLARPQIIGETIDCGPLPTRADTTRTRPDTDTTDTDPGVRVEYRARVPRRHLGAALAEALGHITAAEATAAYAPDTGMPETVRPETVDAFGYLSTDATAAYSADTARTDDTFLDSRARTRAAINTAFDLPGHPDTAGPDTVRTPAPTSLVGQMGEAMLAAWHQRSEDQIEGTALEHCHAMAAAALGHTAYILPPTGYAHVSGRCPACNRTALFLADGGYVTCSHFDCPRPDAATDLLDHPPFRTRTDCNDSPTEGTTTP